MNSRPQETTGGLRSDRSSGPYVARNPETESRRMSRPTDAWSPRRRRDRCTGLSDATPVVIARPHLSANDTTGSKWDGHDLVDLVDALADYTAHLLSRGQLDDLLPDPDRRGSTDRKMAFTSAGPPSIK